MRFRKKVFHTLCVAAVLRNDVELYDFSMVNSHASFCCCVVDLVKKRFLESLNHLRLLD